MKKDFRKKGGKLLQGKINTKGENIAEGKEPMWHGVRTNFRGVKKEKHGNRAGRSS